jgi:hypothetical protein
MSGRIGVGEACRELEQDHRELSELVGLLGRGGDVASMARALAELHGRLTRHFNAEEKPGGLYDALGACAPRHRVLLRGLVDDHLRLAALVREMGDRARRAQPGELDALRGEARHLAGLLADHERRELELVRSAEADGRPGAPA